MSTAVGFRTLYIQPVRVIGFDYGVRRIGVAVSDASGTLARPLTVLRPAGGQRSVLDAMCTEVSRLAGEDDGIGLIVLGLPLRLDGSPTETTAAVLALEAPLRTRTGIPVVYQDERLSSHEAESRLAVNERDWRKRKANLDAAAAAVILQDYLDAHPAPSAREPRSEDPITKEPL
ncbi:MAG: Holliday junction resolvase RuvX [Vicinamibacterales bacterium]